MSKSIVRRALGALFLAAILYVMTLVAANKSITQKEIHTEVIINSPASRVWQVLIDFEAYPQWNPFIRKLTGVARPGNQLTIQMHSGNRTITFRPTVLAVQPDRELRWLGHLFIPGLFDGEHSFNIEPFGENQICMIQHEKFNGLLVPFSGALLDDTKRSFNAMNQELKERSEQTNQKKK